ncbi:MAG: Tol biopolymer transport system component [Chlamydiales bacterium]|jgi:Tol biopolymer transport system component
MPLIAGQTLTHFEILAPLGRGGMGEVWRARDTRLEREVAIKVLPEHFADDADRLRRFEREAKTLASLNHPNVAGIHSVDQVGDTCFLALELVPGEDLSTRLARGPLPLDEAVNLCRQIAEGLEAAHEAGVIHRDLKPANVRITPDGIVKLLDFGLAKPLVPTGRDGGSSTGDPDSFLVTEDGLVLGTPTHMSPEQARGKPVDRRTDAWAFGCVLYECLTGRRAFDGETFSDVMAAILSDDPDWSVLPAETPAPVRRVLRRCLQRDQARRTRHLGDVVLDLDPAEWASASVAADTASDSGTTDRDETHHTTRAPLVGVLALLAALCAAGWARQASRVTTPASQGAPLATSVVLPDGLEVSNTVELSPDGRTLVFAAHDALGEQHVYLRDLDDYALRRVASSRDGTHACFAPDGRSIVFFAHDGLYRTSVEGGNPTRIAAAHSVMGASWGEDGQIVYSTGEGSPLWSVAAEGGSPPRRLTQLVDDAGAYAHVWPQHLPGTRLLLCMTWAGGDQGGPRLLDLDSGSLRVLTSAEETTISPPARWAASGHVILENWDDGLLAQPFDPLGEGMISLGSARQLLEDVANLGDSTRSRFSLSRQGTLAYVPGVADHQRLVWVDLDGHTQTLLEGAEIADYSELSGSLSLSRDGKRALVGGAEELVEVNLVRRLPRRLTNNLSNDSDPQWSADESRVLYQSNRGEHWSVWAIDLEANTAPELVLQRDENVSLTSVGPDGEILFTESGAETRYDVWVREVDGETRALAATRASEREASFSPDGAWVAFQSDATGIDEVHVVAADGEGASTQVSRGGGRAPKWGPGGGSLYFRRGRTVMRVPMQGGRPTGQATAVFAGPRLLPGRCYDISADETRLLAIEVDEDSSLDEIRVITDYFDELRRIAGPGSR